MPKPANNFKPWSERDDLLLSLMIELRYSPEVMAEYLERSELSINSRRHHPNYKGTRK